MRQGGDDGHRRSLGPWTRLRMQLSDATRPDIALHTSYSKHDTQHRLDWVAPSFGMSAPGPIITPAIWSVPG